MFSIKFTSSTHDFNLKSLSEDAILSSIYVVFTKCLKAVVVVFIYVFINLKLK